ncbi:MULTISPECIES: right-handed parallel beta-helix repeat-containing protein [Streptomyces]|uniref:right-handed parallel beta-helix repeat-containing protein n=1 Tax=Streptomyces TaxID=1883 RepID=UPI0007C66C2A|nr:MULTISPECIES: right-handed parallel beta-helix repeat-containing protein [Streptomyces]
MARPPLLCNDPLRPPTDRFRTSGGRKASFALQSPRGAPISRIRTALAVGATLLGTVALPAVGAGSAAAAGGTLSVNNAAGANCTDSGTGTEAAPFCTIAAAAAVVQPGQTVEIADGTYNENLTITRSGTAEAPITFRAKGGNSSFGGGTRIGGFETPVDGFVVKGADHLRFEKLAVFSAFQKTTVLVDGAHDVSFDGMMIGAGAGLHITNGSANVRYGRSSFGYAQGPAITVDGGATGTVVTTNMVQANYNDNMTGILVKDAPNTVVVANTVYSSCFQGIVLDGTSTGAVVENNAVNTARNMNSACGGDPAKSAGITVAQTATAGTKVDYNLIDPSSGGAAYTWAGTSYTDQPSFTVASGGQGVHDFVAPTWVPKGPDSPVNHAVDSADENAPGMLPTDLNGAAPGDDPTVPNTGTGSGIRDRGANEMLDIGSAFTPAGPTRLLDTRLPIGVPAAQAVAPYGTVDLQVAGVAGVPATGVTAVTMNVTVTQPQQDGHLTVFPHGDTAPNSSNLNWVAGRTIPNLVTVPVKDGKVSFFNASGGTVHLIADLEGYYSPKGSLFHAQGPTRLLDTRQPIGVPAAQAVAPYGTVDLQVAGVAGVPASGVTAVTMNVTVTDPQQDGHLTVFPHGDAAPNASNLNWTAGRTIPNLVTVPVKDGKVSFFNASGGTVQLIADLAGYYSAEGKVAYRPAGPFRLVDTRQDTSWESGTRPAGTVPAWGTLDIPVGDIPNVAAVTLNVTVTEPGAEGHLTVYPHGDAAPNASNLNFLPGETIPNQVVVPVKDGMVSLYNASGAPLHLIVDEFGYQAY